jgi:hypothetical protein
MAKAHIAFVKKNHNHRVQLFLGGITILIPYKTNEEFM